MIKQKAWLSFTFTIILTLVNAQESVNQFDTNGKRHGLWTKNYYKTDQKRYEGTFRHGKEVDTFKYYALSQGKSVLSAIKVFSAKDSIADVKFYASNGKVISEGQMNGKRYIGLWIFYHKDSTQKMIEESYNDNGELVGERFVYYDNGVIAEKATYKDGRLDGDFQWFSEGNVLTRTSTYKNDKLNGTTQYKDAKGVLKSSGTYKNNMKIGIWKYYEKGKLKKEIDHSNGNKVIKKYR